MEVNDHKSVIEVESSDSEIEIVACYYEQQTHIKSATNRSWPILRE